MSTNATLDSVVRALQGVRRVQSLLIVLSCSVILYLLVASTSSQTHSPGFAREMRVALKALESGLSVASQEYNQIQSSEDWYDQIKELLDTAIKAAETYSGDNADMNAFLKSLKTMGTKVSRRYSGTPRSTAQLAGDILHLYRVMGSSFRGIGADELAVLWSIHTLRTRVIIVPDVNSWVFSPPLGSTDTYFIEVFFDEWVPSAKRSGTYDEVLDYLDTQDVDALTVPSLNEFLVNERRKFPEVTLFEESTESRVTVPSIGVSFEVGLLIAVFPVLYLCAAWYSWIMVSTIGRWQPPTPREGLPSALSSWVVISSLCARGHVRQTFAILYLALPAVACIMAIVLLPPDAQPLRLDMDSLPQVVVFSPQILLTLGAVAFTILLRRGVLRLIRRFMGGRR
ncbi:MAG TPA: hypothetical protein VM118_06580 [Acidobacteriota bacterium]|nr:hypothetical protein [Acidobacteriota bacterium]